MSIAERLAATLDRVAKAAAQAGRDPGRVRLIAVSKRHPTAAIEEAYAAGQRHFGENYIQELVEKKSALAARCPDIVWHFIGRVQKNKAKDIVLADMVHGVGAARHVTALRNRATGPVPYLLQVNVAGEKAKNGFDQEGLQAFVQQDHEPGWGPQGLMAMGPLGEDPEPTFRRAQQLLHQHQDRLGAGHLSMGMTADFPLAIRYGATHVRVGTAIFGPRPTSDGG